MTKEGPKYVPNPAADVAKEVLDYLITQNDYGNREERTGKKLEQRFGGIGYGWDRDMLRLILAVLFRAGSIEVSQGGEKFSNYSDPRCRPPFINNNTFKSSLFTPVKPIDLKTLTRAVESYEALTGETVDVDKNSICEALKKFAAEEMKTVLPIEAQAKANQLPVVGTLQEYREALTVIEGGSPDDCVNTLAGGGASLKQVHDRVRKIADRLDDEGLVVVRLARRAAGVISKALEAQGEAGLKDKSTALREGLSREDILDSLPSIKQASREILDAFEHCYEARHADRTNQFRAAIEKVKGREEWTAVPETMRQPVLGPLQSRCCEDLKLSAGELACESCQAGLAQMESDIAALGGLFAQVIANIQKATTPNDVPFRRVRLAEFFAGPLKNEQQVKAAIEQLQDHLLKLLTEGVKIMLE